jgi:hypothetical protein
MKLAFRFHLSQKYIIYTQRHWFAELIQSLDFPRNFLPFSESEVSKWDTAVLSSEADQSSPPFRILVNLDSSCFYLVNQNYRRV